MLKKDSRVTYDRIKILSCHEEEPWGNTEINKEIDVDLIKNYFDKVYDN